jgi:hypothetical protein
MPVITREMLKKTRSGIVLARINDTQRSTIREIKRNPNNKVYVNSLQTNERMQKNGNAGAEAQKEYIKIHIMRNQKINNKRTITTKSINDYINDNVDIHVVVPSKSVITLTVAEFAKLIAIMFLDSAHDFNDVSMETFKWVANYVHAFEKYIFQTAGKSLTQNSNDIVKIKKVFNEIINNDLVQYALKDILGKEGSTDLLGLDIGKARDKSNAAQLAHQKALEAAEKDLYFKRTTGWERKCFKHSSKVYQLNNEIKRRTYHLPTVPKGDLQIPFLLDMSSIGNGKTAYANFQKTITLPGLADAGAVFLAENKFFRIAKSYIRLYSEGRNKNQTKSCAKAYNINFSSFHYAFQVNGITMLDVNFLPKSDVNSVAPYTLTINGTKDKKIMSNPEARSTIKELFPESMSNTVNRRNKNRNKNENRNKNFGKLCGIVISKFLGDFSQVMYAYKHNMAFSTGDYMCATSFLVMGKMKDKFFSNSNAKLLTEDSTEMSMTLFYKKFVANESKAFEAMHCGYGKA